MTNEFQINSNVFKRRLKDVYKHWKNPSGEDNIFNTIDAVVVAVGTNEDIMYSKFSSLQIWLFGYELTDMLMAFCENNIYFLASKKKASFLKQIEDIQDSVIPKITVLTRDKADSDKSNFDKVLKALQSSKNGKNMGTFTKEKFVGDFILSWNAALKKYDFEFHDLSHQFALLMAVKDDNELTLIKKSGTVCSTLFSKYFKEKIMEIVDQDKHVKHSKLAEGIEEALTDTKYVDSRDQAFLEVCYSPIIQSGTNHHLKFSIVSDKSELSFDIITCFLGMRYRSYCTNLIRTLLVNPTPQVQADYEFLLECQEQLLNLLHEGKKLSDVYNQVALYVQGKRPELVDKLTKSFGFVTGIEFRDGSLLIGPKCHETISSNMTFNLAFGFSDLTKNDTKTQYGLYVGDTVVVGGADKPATILTPVKKTFKHIAIVFKEEEEMEEEEGSDSGNSDVSIIESGSEKDKSRSRKNSDKATRNQKEKSPVGRALRKTVLENKLRNEATTEDKRRRKQAELFASLNEEARRRLTQPKDAKSDQKVKKSNICYKSRSQMPDEPEIKGLQLFVDKKHETVILPIYGVSVPFHISTIKNISQSVEGGFTYLRLNLFVSGSLLSPQDTTDTTNSADPNHFHKEIIFRSSNTKSPSGVVPSSNLNSAFRLIKEVQKKFRSKEAEEKELRDLVVQDKLELRNPAAFYNNTGFSAQTSTVIRLKDLYIRPNLAQKRITGTLEAHLNGFRYTSIRGDKVDILYGNVKHAFYQPCDHEMIILIHFHLKHGILLGKKKHNDIQFYTEVGEITTDLGKRQHMHDRDDLQSEQAERELRHKLNTAFKTFCDKVENLQTQPAPAKNASTNRGQPPIEFEAPFRELGFHGVPFRSTVLLQPTSSCLINLVEWPPFVITLEELELVHFERVQFHLKNFDMVFVFKDYFKKSTMINAIPMTSLDPVKEWLNSCDIYYTEGIQSLNWTKIMKTITDDPEGFFQNGGWKFLKIESDEESGEDEEEEGENGDDNVTQNGGSKKKKSKREKSYDSDSESDYKPSDSELESSSSSEEEGEGSGDSDEGSGGSKSSESDKSEAEEEEGEESGKDWDELEAEAAKADRERDMNASFEDERSRQKRPGHSKLHGASTANVKRKLNSSSSHNHDSSKQQRHHDTGRSSHSKKSRH